MTDPLFNPGRRIYEQMMRLRRAKRRYWLRKIRRVEVDT